MRKAPYRISEVIKALGKLEVEFSKLEFWLTMYLETLINDNSEIAEIVTAELSIRAKIDLLMSLYRYHEKDENKVLELQRFLARVSKTNKQRNYLIHSTWELSKVSVIRIKKTAKFETGLRKERDRINVLRDIENTIARITKDSEDVRDRLLMSVIENQKMLERIFTEL